MRVCVRQAETGGQRRRFGTFGEERSLVAERRAPGCGNIRLQTTDQRRALLPGRGAPGSYTHCTSSNSFSAGAVWVGALLSHGERERAFRCVCVCVEMLNLASV